MTIGEQAGRKEQLQPGAPAPPDDAESAMFVSLPAGGAAYTTIVSGVNNTTGMASVEIYVH